MNIRLLNLDDACRQQTALLETAAVDILDLRDWGPLVRLACGFGTWKRFAECLKQQLEPDAEAVPIHFLGSGDFHHVTLALLNLLEQPFNLLILDKHPDWMRGIPFMHCGTWLHHALQLPNLMKVYHVGGDLDFDNAWRWLAPWSDLRSGKIRVLPAHRIYRTGAWGSIPHHPLLHSSHNSIADSLRFNLKDEYEDLTRFPLYISLDKDLMYVRHALVNWDSGTLSLDEVKEVLAWFIQASAGRLLGMDIVGDWSVVELHRGIRTLCHWIEHPRLNIDPLEAAQINGQTNCQLLTFVQHCLDLVPHRRERVHH